MSKSENFQGYSEGTGESVSHDRGPMDLRRNSIKCGMVNDADAVYCTNCGAVLPGNPK